MIKVTCQNITLSEIINLPSIDKYGTMVHPIEYEFDLIKNSCYFTIGILTRLGTPWLYVFPALGDKEIRLVPAILFAFDWSEIPEHWLFRIIGREDIEILPVSLAKIDHWFEKYVNKDFNIITFLDQEIEKVRRGTLSENSERIGTIRKRRSKPA